MQVHRNLSELPNFQNAIVTIGSFDGVHEGHRSILSRVQRIAEERHGESIVVTFDPHPRLFFQPDLPDFFLITTLSEKIALIESCGIDHLVVVPFDTAFSSQSADAYVHDFLVKKLRAEHIIIGYDHRFGKGRTGDIDFLKKKQAASGFTVEQISKYEEEDIAVSSSKIRDFIKAGNLAKANRLLGAAFTLSGTVIKGKQLGRKIGFPTANIQLESKHKIIPKEGIYAAKVTMKSDAAKAWKAMLYIGSRPTLHDKRGRTIEVNILDFEGDLYGASLRVEPIEFIREDAALEDLAALKNQIQNDKNAILSVFRKGEKSTEIKQKQAKNKQYALKTAVVILNYNTRDQLLEYLPNVIEHSAGAEIIVADNGSPDDSCAVLRTHFPEVTRIELPENYGFAGGYNEALKQVQADVYVLLNSDVQVAPNWLDAPLALLEKNEKIAIVQPKILALKKPTHFEHAGAAAGWMDALSYPFCRGRIFTVVEEDTGQYDSPQACFWAAGAAYFVRAHIYDDFGGFDADYFAHNEEIDLCWRVKNAGYSVWCTPASVVYHLGGGTLDYDNPRKVFLNFRNSLFSILKNDTRINIAWKIPMRFFLDGLAGVRFLLKGQFASIWAIVRAHFSFHGQIGAMLRKRKENATLIEAKRIGPKNTEGIYIRSIVWSHYIQRIKTFERLKIRR